jgi:uncharacterized protein YbbC (DUF1343 family)
MACVLVYGLGGWLTGCGDPAELSDVASNQFDSVVRVKTGAQVLSESGFGILSGKRVGLVTNPTAQVDGVHLIDWLHDAPDVELVALFGPEHGLRGNAEAGAAVDDGLDDATGIPVYSLYGTTNAPAPEILATLDVLVFDIQDIGARFYTYIATMGRSMQAAARAGIPFVVLDRPNPLGGELMDGYVLDMEFSSGVGPYPIPVQHGLTVGELAQMIKGERYLEDVEAADLTVVSMEGWTRDMLWPDTGLEWIATSPNIPTFETALVYMGTCFFEAVSASEGRGTPNPFLTVGAPWLDANAAVQALRNRQLAGVQFEAGTVTPESIPGVANNPSFDGTEIEVVQISLTDAGAYRPLTGGLEVLKVVMDLAPDSARSNLVDRRWMGLLSGGDRLADGFDSGLSVDDLAESWAAEINTFRLAAAPYKLYD